MKRQVVLIWANASEFTGLMSASMLTETGLIMDLKEHTLMPNLDEENGREHGFILLPLV